MFLLLLEFFVFLCLLYLLLSQITLPILANKPLFPMLRKSRNDAKDRLKEANATEEDLNLTKDALETEQAIKKLAELLDKLEKEGKVAPNSETDSKEKEQK